MVIDVRDKKVIIFGVAFILILVGLLMKALILKQNPTGIGAGPQNIEISTGRAKKENKVYFIPDGVYLLSKPVEFGIYQFDSFTLKTVEKKNEGSAEYVLTKPKAVIALVINSQKSCLYFECPDPILKKEKLFIKSVETPIGEIIYEGAFFDRQGKPWLEPVVEYKETIVHGQLRVAKNGAVVYSEPKNFTYWDGAVE